MSENTFKRTLYIKAGCPFCTKLLFFMAEVQILDTVVFKYDTDENRAYLEEHSGRKPTFPAIELEPKKIMYETDDIIDLFAKEVKVDPATLPVLNYFNILKGDYLKLMKHIGFPQVLEQVAEKRKEIKLSSSGENPDGPGLLSEGFEKPKLYLKRGCPFCTKFMCFLAEANLVNQVELLFDTQENRSYIENSSGRKPSFPVIELEPKVFKFETNDLIEMCARVHKIDVPSMIAFPYFTNGMFVNFIALVKIIGHDDVVKVLSS